MAFWILLAYGWLTDELTLRGLIGFLISWAAGLYALRYFPAGADTAFVAVLDIALVFLIFRQ